MQEQEHITARHGTTILCSPLLNYRPLIDPNDPITQRKARRQTFSAYKNNTLILRYMGHLPPVKNVEVYKDTLYGSPLS